MIYTVNSPFGVVRVVALKGERGAGVEDVRKEVAALKGAVGSPLVATTAAGMTDKTKVYVYTGSESGYTSGHWYYWNGSAWTDGGVYNATAVNTDTTLSVAGAAADAATTGTEVVNIKNVFNQAFARPIIVNEGSAACAYEYAKAIKALWFEFDSDEDEDAFWDGQHTKGSTTTKSRNIGLSYVPNENQLNFYWLNDNGIYIASDQAFTIKKAGDVRFVIDDNEHIIWHRFDKTLDLNHVIVNIIVDWTIVSSVGDRTVFNAPFAKGNNRLYNAIFRFISNDEHTSDLFGNAFMRPLVPIIGSDETAHLYSKSVESLWFEFDSDEDEDAFWDGQHVKDSLTTKTRKLGLSHVPDGATLRFFWFRDDGRYIASDPAFTVNGSSDVVYIADSTDDVRQHRFGVVLDGYNVVVHIVVNWTAVSSIGDTTVFSAEFVKGNNRLYRELFELKSGYNLWRSPIKTSGITNKSTAISIIRSIKGVLFEFDTEEDEVSFWSGDHTHDGATSKRNFGPTIYGVDVNGKKYIRWYWMNNSNHYITGDSAFIFGEGSGVVSVVSGISTHKLTSYLDGYKCTVYMTINWGELPSTENEIITHTFYDKSSIDYQKILYGFSGVKTAQQELNDINFGVDGDSITAGNQWSYLVANKLGYNTHHNVAVGSSTFQDEIVTYNGITYYPQIYGESGWLGMSDGWGEIPDADEAQKRANNCVKNHILKFIDEVDNGLYPAPDIFVFAMGTNDAANRLGSISEAFASTEPLSVDDELLRTTIGAMRWAIQKIKTEYPDCKILWSTPIQSSVDSRNSGNEIKVPVMTEAAKLLSVQIIDQRNNSGISAIMEKANQHYLRDGVHPNDYGRAAMAQCAFSVLSTIRKQ